MRKQSVTALLSASAQSIVQRASVSWAFTNTRLPATIGTAQGGVSATLYRATSVYPLPLGRKATR